MNDRARILSTVAVLLLLAAGLRFYDLAVWQYAPDEMASVDEERVLFHGAPAATESQEYRLPHAIPLGYLAIHISHTVFGDDPRGTRVILALLGSLGVVLVFLLLDGPMSRITAIVAAVLVALMPAHILYSQFTRFYMVATFCAFAALLAGARALGQRSTLFATIACSLALVAVLCHSVLLVLLPLLVVAVGAGFYAQGRAVPRSVWLVFAAAATALSVFFLLYLRPLLHGWNQGESWGYSPLHAILASIVMIGWPTALLVALGCVLMLRQRTAQNWYWLACLAGWIAASVLLPAVVSYHPGYVFPLTLAALVVAAYASGFIYDLLRKAQMPLAAYAWIGVSCLGNVPALASYYVDGARNDLRGAAAYVRAHWRPGDRVTGYSMTGFRQNSGGCCEPAIPLPLDARAAEQLARLGSEGGRLWVVLENKRAGLEPQLQRWLFACAVHKLSLGGRRFDDEEFKEEVYLIPSALDDRCAQGLRR
jgi:hypothetical protein